ncbi:MAG: VIT domain-containing protein [Bacteroidia bacterium]|nr:VIT domain-containing protein [Bacteroidia bacterium]
MKHIYPMLLLVVACLQGLAQPNSDRSLSPYFQIISDDPAVDQLPLKHTEAEVKIAGVIADVRIRQIYQNEGTRPIEAIYTFPASTRAAVYGMTMQVGDRVLEAKIKERQQARQIYEEAQAQGRTTSLLEQQRPNIFQMNVANIQPGDSIVLELRYTELLVPEEGIYEFVYPTVVGPRYTGATPPSALQANSPKGSIPYQQQGEAPSYTFGFKAQISAGMPVQSVSSPSHDLEINKEDPAHIEIRLGDEDLRGGNRDLVLRYSLEGNAIQSGMITYQENGEKFFLLMAQPPQRVKPEEIPPREYVFIVDKSGSMNGFPLEVSKTLMKNLLNGMNKQDKFNVMLFASGSQVLFPDGSRPATIKNIDSIFMRLTGAQGAGGTELLPALQRALALPSEEGYSRVFVILTDGYVSIEGEAFRLIRENIGEANFFAFGIGSSVNRHLIEGIAEAGKGTPFVALDRSMADSLSQKFKEYVESPVLTDVVVHFGDMDAYDLEPLGLPDLFAERPIVVSGKYRGRPGADLRLTGVTGAGAYEAQIPVGDNDLSDDHRAIRYLWARERIARLSDQYDPETKARFADQVTQLGLTYNLLTEQTSFVAVDKKRRAEEADSTVVQPLPLPKGVSNQAVGQLSQSYSSSSALPQSVTSQLAGLSLDEVVVVGYGTQQSTSVTASVVSTRQTGTIAEIPGSLEGKIAGVQVLPSSGQPGASEQIRIRGLTGIGSSQSPLLIIDGVPQPSDPGLTQPLLGIAGSPQAIDPLANLDPSQIKNITVLKDAAASSIYGSRAANGVIVIETKKFSPGEKWKANVSQGIAMLRAGPELMDAQQYAALYEAATGEVKGVSGLPANWLDSLYRPAFIQSYGLAYSNYSWKKSFSLSGNYEDQQGIVNHNDLKSLRTSATYQRRLLRDKLVLSSSQHLAHHWGTTVPTGDSARLAWSPISLAWMLPPIGSSQSIPFSTFPELQSTLWNGQVAGDLSIGNHWTFHSTLAGRYQTQQLSQLVSAGIGSLDQQVFRDQQFSHQHTGFSHAEYANWAKNLGQHQIAIRLFFSQDWLSLDSRYESRWSAEEAFGNILATNNWNWTPSQWHSEGGVRLKYDYKNLLSLTYRQSLAQFTPFGKSWKSFPAVEAVAKLTELPGLDHLNWLTRLNVGFSSGITGNALGRSPYEVAVQRYVPAFAASTSTRQLSPLIWSDSLSWGHTLMNNIFLSTRLFNKVDFAVNLYRNTNQNPYWPGIEGETGNTYVLQGGAIQNQGWEATLSYRTYGRLAVSTSLTFAQQGNMVTALPGARTSLHLLDHLPWSYVEVGQSPGLLYGYQADGLYQQGDDFSAEPGKQAGDLRLRDLNGDGSITEADRSVIGRTLPRAFGGASIDISYEDWSLEGDFSGAWGYDVLNYQLLAGRDALTGEFNALALASDFWTESNTSATVPRPSQTPETRITDRLVESGAHLRLSSLVLKWESNSGIAARPYIPAISLTGRNLFVLTSYSGADPGMQAQGGDPFLGIGVDMGTYPLPRVVQLGLSWAW